MRPPAELPLLELPPAELAFCELPLAELAFCELPLAELALPERALAGPGDARLRPAGLLPAGLFPAALFPVDVEAAATPALFRPSCALTSPVGCEDTDRDALRAEAG